MKNYLTEWKKWKSVLTEAKTLDQIAQDKAKLAAEEAETLRIKAAEEKKRKEEEIKRAREEQTRTGVSSPKPTANLAPPPLEEAGAMSVGMRADGSVGPQPGYAADRENANENANGPKNLALDEEELTEEELEEACGEHKGIDESGRPCNIELQYEEVEEQTQCNECRDCMMCGLLTEAKYKGRKVALGKPMRGDVKKFKVFVRDPSTGNIKKVNFGDKKMRIKKSNPKRRKSFRARHRCANPGPRTKARYWSCRKW